MIRSLFILTIFPALFSCNSPEKKPAQKPAQKSAAIPSMIDLLEPDRDTLPNGKRLLDNVDSGMVHYYKEVVGSDTLQGGYITCYGIDDSTKYFYLRHGKQLHLLNQGSIYASTWGLGTLEKDFAGFFMTSIDNGNGCPASYQLFDKKTGLNILGPGAEADSYAYLNDTLFMLYDTWHEHKRTGEICLFNVSTKKRESFALPDSLPDFCDIQIDRLTRRTLKLSFSAYVGDFSEMTRTYKR